MESFDFVRLIVKGINYIRTHVVKKCPDLQDDKCVVYSTICVSLLEENAFSKVKAHCTYIFLKLSKSYCNRVSACSFH